MLVKAFLLTAFHILKIAVHLHNSSGIYKRIKLGVYCPLWSDALLVVQISHPGDQTSELESFTYEKWRKMSVLGYIFLGALDFLDIKLTRIFAGYSLQPQWTISEFAADSKQAVLEHRAGANYCTNLMEKMEAAG